MFRLMLFSGILGMLAGLPPAPAEAQIRKIWFSPLRTEEEWRTTRPAPIMTIEPGSPSSTVLMSTSDATSTLRVLIPLTVPSNFLITSVTVCYQTSDPATQISKIRLTEMRDPNLASIRYDEPTVLNSTAPECFESVIYPEPEPEEGYQPDGTVTLRLFLDFADVSHTIELGGISLNGQLSLVDAPGSPSPGELALRQNVPNPFAGSTTIDYELPDAGPVELLVFDVAGRKIRTLEQGTKPAGSYRAVWDARDDNGNRVVPGVYFYQARIGDRLGSKRMVLAR